MSRIRKILILTQYFSPEPGAPSIRLGQMVKHLTRNDIDISVITAMPNYPLGKIFPKYRGRIFTREVIEGADVLRVPIYPATGKKTLARLLNYISFMLTSFFPLLFSKRVDLIFVEAQPVILAIPAYIVSRIRNIPYVYNTPDLQVEYASEDSWIGISLLINFAKNLESFLMKRSLSVSTVTHGFIRYFHSKKGVNFDKFTFLPNGSDLENLSVSLADESYAKKFGVLGKKVFTFAGTFAPYQGINILIEAAKLIDDDEIIFLLAGKGPEKKSIKERVENEKIKNIKFIDSPFEEMNKLMSITYASVVLLRNLEISKLMRLSKTFPPLACGVPVVFSGLGESAEIIKNTNAGVVIDPENPEKLAKAISFLAKNPKKRDQMGLNGRKYIENNLSWEFIVNDWLRQIENVRSKRKPLIPNLSNHK